LDWTPDETVFPPAWTDDNPFDLSNNSLFSFTIAFESMSLQWDNLSTEQFPLRMDVSSFRRGTRTLYGELFIVTEWESSTAGKSNRGSSVPYVLVSFCMLQGPKTILSTSSLMYDIGNGSSSCDDACLDTPKCELFNAERVNGLNVIVLTCFSSRFDNKGGVSNDLQNWRKINLIGNGRTAYVVEKQLLVEGRYNLASLAR
jgi:hypothetical protein